MFPSPALPAAPQMAPQGMGHGLPQFLTGALQLPWDLQPMKVGPLKSFVSLRGKGLGGGHCSGQYGHLARMAVLGVGLWRQACLWWEQVCGPSVSSWEGPTLLHCSSCSQGEQRLLRCRGMDQGQDGNSAHSPPPPRLHPPALVLFGFRGRHRPLEPPQASRKQHHQSAFLLSPGRGRADSLIPN